MISKSVFDPEFADYGKVVEGYDFTALLGVLRQISPKPEDAVIYVPSVEELEALPVCQELSDRAYGGMPIQIGYCNGSNTKLNSLEYHRDSEINIADDDMILLLGREQDIQNGQSDTAKVKAFRVPKGCAVEVYATTLHYAPCEGNRGAGDLPGLQRGNPFLPLQIDGAVVHGVDDRRASPGPNAVQALGVSEYWNYHLNHLDAAIIP